MPHARLWSLQLNLALVTLGIRMPEQRRAAAVTHFLLAKPCPEKPACEVATYVPHHLVGSCAWVRIRIVTLTLPRRPEAAALRSLLRLRPSKLRAGELLLLVLLEVRFLDITAGPGPHKPHAQAGWIGAAPQQAQATTSCKQGLA